MNSFLVLCAVLSVASARPDVSLGYKYTPPNGSAGVGVHHDAQQTSHVSSGLLAPSLASSSSSSSLSSSSSSSSVPALSGLFSSATNTAYVPAVSTVGVGSNVANGYYAQQQQQQHHSSSVQHDSYHYQQQQQQQHHQAPIVTKHFYLHSAPEEQADQVTRHITIGQPQKNYRVVFIKAPSASASNAKITASYAPTEEKTVIYVLSQKQDDLQVETVHAPVPTEPSKPEVFFVKYKTPEEAAHAQQQIQAQYDSLGGTSHVSNEGQASVTSVVGILGGAGSSQNHHHHQLDTAADTVHSGVVGSSHSHPVSETYLPSSH